MLNNYNVYYNGRLVDSVVSTDDQSAIKTVWMRSGHSASRYSCRDISDFEAIKSCRVKEKLQS